MNMEAKIFNAVCDVLEENVDMSGIQIVDYITNTIADSSPEVDALTSFADANVKSCILVSNAERSVQTFGDASVFTL